MTSLRAYLYIISGGWLFHFKSGPKTPKPSAASVACLTLLSLLMALNHALAAPLEEKKLTSAVNLDSVGSYADETVQLSNQKLPWSHYTSLAKTQEIPLDGPQPNKPIPKSLGLPKTMASQINITRDPNDNYPPFDLRIQIDVQYLGSSELTWGSTELTFPSKQPKAIGGSSTCTNRPIPALKLNPVNTKLSYRLRSSNTYKMDFDWRLFEGRHQPLLRLFTGQNCRKETLIHTRTFEIDFIP